MIKTLIVHSLIEKERKFVLDNGTELSPSISNSSDGNWISMNATIKVDKKQLDVESFSIYCDGLLVKSLPRIAHVPVWDVLSLRYTIYV